MAFSMRSQECFNKVLSHSLRTAASDIFSSGSLLEAAANDEDLAQVTMSRIMLTIAGIDFRITFLLHYRDDELIRSVIKSAANE